MRILYGVVGSGMGHAIRSSVVIRKLIDEGHEVHIVASGGAVGFLKQRFGGVTEIWGLDMVVVDNEVDKLMTAAQNAKGLLKRLPANVREFFEVESEFAPEVVISDFETWSWMFGKFHGRPIICIDNIQIINRCTHAPEILEGEEDNFQIAKSIVKARTPRANEYLITTFFHPPVRKKRTRLVPPILRPSILEAKVETGDHVLVYQTSDSFKTLPDMLKQLDVPVLVYGLRRGLESDQVDGNLVYRPFSDTQFVEDLATCSGVIASAGFTLMSEAVHLGKPYLATPVGGQFEQILNARYLKSLGYGSYEMSLTPEALVAFTRERERYQANLATYERHDNTVTLEALDHFLNKVAAGLI
ncbi:MAG: glycosyltransferase family protein [bacterium]